MRFLFVCILKKRVGIAFESIDDADFGRLLVPFDALAFYEKNWFQVIHEPGQPVQPVQLVQSGQPGQPGQPVKPGQPGQPEKQVQLVQPGQPGQPVQPGQPAQVKISNENQWKGEIQTNPKSIQNQTLNNKALVLN